MLALDRRRRLVVQVRTHGSVEVDPMARSLGVSASTIRRDLAALEAQGQLRRAHGGAYIDGGTAQPAKPDADPDDGPAKQRIGRRAADHVHDHSTVMILAGSTTAAMLPYLAQRSVTVVTNGLDVGHTVAAFPGISLVMLGGVLHREQRALLGPLTEQNMADLHVDVMFAGAYGIHPDGGVTGSKIIAAGYHHSMLRHTDALVVLADASKFGRQGPTRLAAIDQVATFITDQSAPESVLTALREQGASVEIS